MPAIPQITSFLETALEEVKTAVTSIDVGAVIAVSMLTIALILLFDLLVYLFVSEETARSLYITPMIGQAVVKAWNHRDEITNHLDSRSLDNLSPVIAAIETAINKWN